MACKYRNEPTTIEAAQEDDSEIKSAGSSEACTICLQPITERAVASPCNHLAFDFICLASWLQDHDTCPLCKATVVTVQYDWRSPTEFKTYRVRQTRGNNNHANPTSRQRNFHRNTHVSNGGTNLTIVEDPSLDSRRRVYREGLYALHIGSNALSRFADFSPQDFASSTELQSRARTFLRRELLIFAFLDRTSALRVGGRQYLVEYIVAVLKIHHPKGADGQAEDLLVQPLGRANAIHLLHELMSWLRSPFTRLEEWDEVVKYKRDCDDEDGKHARQV
nr:putative ring finger protein c16g5.03 [Quercus suber]